MPKTRHFEKRQAITPWRIFFKILLIIFFTEALIMMGLNFLPKFPPVIESLIDAIVLACLSSIPIWFWIIRPIDRFISEHLFNLENLENAIDEAAIVAITDVKGTITYANNKFSEISGFSEEELIGANHRIINSQNHEKTLFADLWQTVLAGRIWRGELRNKTKNNQYYWVKSVIVPFKDINHKISQFFSISFDVTQRKEAEIALTEAKNQADAAVRVKSEFLANMSHEIRTPLNGILGIVSLLEEESLSKSARNHLEVLKTNGENLRELINDILDFSKLEAQKLQIENVNFDILKLLKDILKIFKIRAEEKGIHFALELSSEMPQYLVSDELKIKQVISNLVSNAIKFTSKGSVTLTAQVEKRSSSLVKILIEVSDTGIGIPREMQSKLFQSFSQIDGSTTRKYGGTGLGLAISKGICEALGGEIDLESHVGEGSKFWFSFFAEEGHAVANSDNTLLIENMAKKFPFSILVADDNETNQLLARIFLEKLGYSPTIVGDGASAISKFNENNFDFIFMDIHMPKVDGLEAAKHIRNLVKDESAPWIVALTASANKEAYEKCLRAGMNDFVAKPFQTADLARALWRAGQLRKIRNHFLEGAETLSEIVELYLKVLPREISLIRQAINRNDAAASFKLVHRLKGSISHFVHDELSLTLGELEGRCERGDLTEAMKQFERIENLLRELAELLVTHVQKKSAA